MESAKTTYDIIKLARENFEKKNFELSKQNFELFFQMSGYKGGWCKESIAFDCADFSSEYISCLCKLKNIDIYNSNYYDKLWELHQDINEKISKKIKLTNSERNKFSIRIYTLDEEFKWGKYINNKIEDVLIKDPNYVLWCIIYIDHFSIEDNIFLYDEVKFRKLYDKALEINLIKKEILNLSYNLEDDSEKSSELKDDYGEYNDEYNFRYGFDGNNEAWDNHNQ